MSCHQWRDQIGLVSVDEMEPKTRRDYLSHLSDCLECRRLATRNDPTIVFSLLPAAEVREEEVDQVRQNVRALRRTRAVERTAASKVPRRLVLGAIAATLLIAVTLIPQRRLSENSRSVPFAGAVGVGSGLVQIPQASSSTASGVLQLKLNRGAEGEPGVGMLAPYRVWEVDIPARGERRVERQLAGGYRLHFLLVDSPHGDVLELKDFELLQIGGAGEVSLLAADLRAEPNRQVMVDVPGKGKGSETMWLELTWSKNTMASR